MKWSYANAIGTGFLVSFLVMCFVVLPSGNMFGNEICEKLDFQQYPQKVQMDLEYKCPQIVRRSINRSAPIQFLALWFLFSCVFMGFVKRDTL